MNTMGESQSRYSIVERLTQTKLDLLGAKNQSEEHVTMCEERLADMKTSLDYYKVKSEADRKSEIAEKEKAITDMEAKIKTAKAKLVGKDDVLKSKLAAVEEALKAVKEISSESAKQEQKS